MADPRFEYPKYMVRKKVLKILGGAFHIYGPEEQLVMYAEQKAFKLKEDIRLFADESMTTEALVILARQIIDLAAVYDVHDPVNNQRVGSLKRMGLKSLFKDEWIIMDAGEREIGRITEDSTALALVRRFLTNLIPQSFSATVGGREVCHFKQNFNPFVLKLNVDFTPDTSGALDKRLGLAAAVLLTAIEGRQQ